MKDLKVKYPRRHNPTSVLGSAKILSWIFYELIIHFKKILALRQFYKSREVNRSDPSIALAGDNLDEVNGIALHSRTFVRTMRKQSRKVYLIGVAFHDKKPRMEVPGGSIFMLPGRTSMDLPGYQTIEIAVPRLDLLLTLLRHRPIDLIEIETPNPMGFMALVLGKILKIQTVFHYRTDLPSYAKMLIANPLGAWFVEFWVKWFTRLCGPVIVPSVAFLEKVEALGVSRDKIYKLPRGVDLKMFNPEKKNLKLWADLIPFTSGTRVIYMGRISKEKNLPMLLSAFRKILTLKPGVNLTIIGGGPYLPEMKTGFNSHPCVFFSGFLRGSNLASVLASADFLVFPSTTDTFGNSVIEALASGLPCIVSDKGGPQEIIENGKSGLVFDSESEEDLIDKILFMIDNPEKLQELKHNARERAMNFTHEKSADKFWAFYKEILKK